MSKIKTMQVLESLGGSAYISDIRKKAKKMYPDLQLARTIHTQLKQLADEGKVKKNKGARIVKRKPEIIWTSTKPQYKTAAQLKKEDENKKMLDFVGFGRQIVPAPPPVIEPEKQKAVIIPQEKEKTTIESRYIPETTLTQELKEAIKEPYLDKLKDVVENIEIKSAKYRGRYEIIQDILSYLEKGPSLITPLMYQTNLSVNQMKRYKSILLKNKLIESVSNGYQLTQEGRVVLAKMLEIKIDFD